MYVCLYYFTSAVQNFITRVLCCKKTSGTSFLHSVLCYKDVFYVTCVAIEAFRLFLVFLFSLVSFSPFSPPLSFPLSLPFPSLSLLSSLLFMYLFICYK